MLKDLITPKVFTDPGRLINFFTPTVKSPQTLGGNSQGFNLPQGLWRPFVLFPAYPKVHTDPGFGYLTEKAFYLNKYYQFTLC
jgi:hypothetical protein